jgi:hypothetical protein
MRHIQGRHEVVETDSAKNRLDGPGQDKGLALLGLESTHIWGRIQIVGT